MIMVNRNGIKIDRSTGTETSADEYSASDFIACDTSKTYTLNLTSSIASYNGNVFICYYNGSKSYISCSSNYIGSYQSSAEQFTAELSFLGNAKYIKLRFFTDKGASNIDKSIIILTTN